MKKKQAFAMGLLFILGICQPPGAAQAADIILPPKTPVQVFFSPQGGCTKAVLDHIARARREILIQAYSFRSAAIADALIIAKKKGVNVELVMDKSERQEGLTPPTLMSQAGIPVYLDGEHALANNRIMIIDRNVTLTGSYNFNTPSEEMNAENLLIIESPDLSNLYRANWLEHRKHSAPF